RAHEALKTNFEFLRRVSAQLDSRIEIARRLPVGIVLCLLLGGGGRFRDLRFGCGSRGRGHGFRDCRHRRGHGRRNWIGRLFFRGIAQFSVGGEQALVAYFEFTFFSSFLSHRVYRLGFLCVPSCPLWWRSANRPTT